MLNGLPLSGISRWRSSYNRFRWLLVTSFEGGCAQCAQIVLALTTRILAWLAFLVAKEVEGVRLCDCFPDDSARNLQGKEADLSHCI